MKKVSRKFKLIPLDPQPDKKWLSFGYFVWYPSGETIGLGKIEACLMHGPENTVSIQKNNKGLYCWKIQIKP